MFLGDKELNLIEQHKPQLRAEQSLLQAAVAIVLRDTPSATEFLMMQRAFHEDDPWSGQMSFPGGKIDPQDSSARAAAERETREEVGLKLRPEDYVGQLDDLYGLKVNQRYSVLVSCFVYKPAEITELVPNYEVADLIWLPVSTLAVPDNAHDYYHPHDEMVKMPAVLLDDDKQQVLWGLSLRMISMLYDVIDWDLPVLSADDQLALRQIDQRNIVGEPAEAVAAKLRAGR